MTQEQFIGITEWQNKTFGQSTASSKIHHLKQEIDELLIDVKEHNEAAELEFADCFILLFGAADSFGLSYSGICKAIDTKMSINKSRQWGFADENGVVNHIKK